MSVLLEYSAVDFKIHNSPGIDTLPVCGIHFQTCGMENGWMVIHQVRGVNTTLHELIITLIVELHAEVFYAECSLLEALLTFLQVRNCNLL